MKTRRFASAVAISAALTLGLAGCGLIAPQGTTDSYAPSDGIEQSIGGVDVRNLMLIADETGENFNVVFTGVNNGDAPIELRMTFVSASGSAQANADFTIEPGVHLFGDPVGEQTPILVSIPDLRAGATVTTYLQVAGAEEIERQVPVLDGTLPEYAKFVLSPSQVVTDDDGETADEGDGQTPGEAVADGDVE